jgi:hypothetical protein
MIIGNILLTTIHCQNKAEESTEDSIAMSGEDELEQVVSASDQVRALFSQSAFLPITHSTFTDNKEGVSYPCSKE